MGMKWMAMMAAAFLAATAHAATPYRTENIMLMQPDFVLKERVRSIQALSGYIQDVQSAAGRALTGEQPHPASGYLVIAVRPGGESMVWLDLKPGLPGATASRLRSAILAVPAFEASGGVVVFALNASLWDSPVMQGFPHPQEWSEAMDGRDEPMEIGDLVDKIWPGRTGG